MPSAVSHCSRCSSPFGFKLSCWTYEGFHCSSPYLRVNYITPNIMYVVWSVFRCFRRAVYKVGQILPISNWFSFLYWNALIWWLILIALSIYGSRWDCVIKDALTQDLRSPLQTGSPLFASVWLSSHFCTHWNQGHHCKVRLGCVFKCSPGVPDTYCFAEPSS